LDSSVVNPPSRTPHGAAKWLSRASASLCAVAFLIRAMPHSDLSSGRILSISSRGRITLDVDGRLVIGQLLDGAGGWIGERVEGCMRPARNSGGTSAARSSATCRC